MKIRTLLLITLFAWVGWFIAPDSISSSVIWLPIYCLVIPLVDSEKKFGIRLILYYLSGVWAATTFYPMGGISGAIGFMIVYGWIGNKLYPKKKSEPVEEDDFYKKKYAEWIKKYPPLKPSQTAGVLIQPGHQSNTDSKLSIG